MRSAGRTGVFLTALLVMGTVGVTVGQAETIGEVSTTFKLLGANDKIVIEAFDDPDIKGATCYLSRAKTGGIKGTVGLAEDKSDASIACRQTGPITLPEDVRNGKDDGERVFRKSTSLLFKKMQVVRFYDPKRNTLVYLTYSDKFIDGSPKNSISTIVVRPWEQNKKSAQEGQGKE
ncbi:MAG: CreA family protein [Candidatus Electrothrix sp.]